MIRTFQTPLVYKAHMLFLVILSTLWIGISHEQEVLKVSYSGTWLKRPQSKLDKTKVLKISGSLVQVQSIAECSTGCTLYNMELL